MPAARATDRPSWYLKTKFYTRSFCPHMGIFSAPIWGFCSRRIDTRASSSITKHSPFIGVCHKCCVSKGVIVGPHTKNDKRMNILYSIGISAFSFIKCLFCFTVHHQSSSTLKNTSSINEHRAIYSRTFSFI